MSHTCKEIEENKGSYQKYRFEAVSRHDEIGQLAVTFEGLLKTWIITRKWNIPAGWQRRWRMRSRTRSRASAPVFSF
ncbi:MAG: hypothetical protein ACLTR6_08470 [Clostridium fessum]